MSTGLWAVVAVASAYGVGVLVSRLRMWVRVWRLGYRQGYREARDE